MSLDMFVYSPNSQPVEVGSLLAAARAEGWEIRVLRNFSDWFKYDTVADGSLMDVDELCGWRLKDPRAPSIAEAVQNRVGKVIERLFSRDAIGCCRLFIHEPEEADDKASASQDEDDEDHPAFLRGVFEPRLIYTLNTGSGSGIVSGELFEKAALWIAKACCGAWCDPQSDDHESYHSRKM